MTISWATLAHATRPRRSPLRSTRSRLPSGHASFFTSRTAVRCLGTASCAFLHFLQLTPARPSGRCELQAGRTPGARPTAVHRGLRVSHAWPVGEPVPGAHEPQSAHAAAAAGAQSVRDLPFGQLPTPACRFHGACKRSWRRQSSLTPRTPAHTRSTFGMRRSAVRPKWRSTRKTTMRTRLEARYLRRHAAWHLCP